MSNDLEDMMEGNRELGTIFDRLMYVVACCDVKCLEEK